MTAWPPKTEAISITVTFAPRRPSSNAADSPEMPAPIIIASASTAVGGGSFARAGDSTTLPSRTQIQTAIVTRCLKVQGGLDACRLAFYKEGDLGDDGIWDNWRLEGPSFVWYFRGKPHVHVWVNVADTPDIELNSYQDSVGV